MITNLHCYNHQHHHQIHWSQHKENVQQIHQTSLSTLSITEITIKCKIVVSDLLINWMQANVLLEVDWVWINMNESLSVSDSAMTFQPIARRWRRDREEGEGDRNSIQTQRQGFMAAYVYCKILNAQNLQANLIIITIF